MRTNVPEFFIARLYTTNKVFGIDYTDVLIFEKHDNLNKSFLPPFELG